MSSPPAVLGIQFGDFPPGILSHQRRPRTSTPSVAPRERQGHAHTRVPTAGNPQTHRCALRYLEPSPRGVQRGTSERTQAGQSAEANGRGVHGGRRRGHNSPPPRRGPRTPPRAHVTLHATALSLSSRLRPSRPCPWRRRWPGRLWRLTMTWWLPGPCARLPASPAGFLPTSEDRHTRGSTERPQDSSAPLGRCENEDGGWQRHKGDTERGPRPSAAHEGGLPRGLLAVAVCLSVSHARGPAVAVGPALQRATLRRQC